MGTQNSGLETRDRATRLANDIGSYHIDFNFDTVVTSIMNLFTVITNFQPRFKMHGGSPAENAALQNVQARLRMVLSYLFASLLPTVRQRPGGGSLLVLASSNVDGKSLKHEHRPSLSIFTNRYYRMVRHSTYTNFLPVTDLTHLVYEDISPSTMPALPM